MEALKKAPAVPAFSSELAFLAALRDQAIRDADAVGALLRELNEIPVHGIGDSDLPHLSVEMLLGLAIAMRFKRWELNFVKAHIDAGLPSSAKMFETLLSLNGRPEFNKFVNSISELVLVVFHDSIIWSGEICDLRADMAITAGDENQLVDALAEFLIKLVAKDE